MEEALKAWVDPEKAALVIVDVQNDFLSSEGLLGKAGNDMGLYQGMVHQRLVPFLEEARKAGMRVIFVQMESSRWTNSPVSLEKSRSSRVPYARQEVAEEEADVVCRKGSWGAEFYVIQPQGGRETVVKKHRYSAFIDTNLNVLLRAQGIGTILLTGVAGNVCVESTARDAFMFDYRVLFVEDCTASRSEEQQKATLVNIDKFFGYVVNSREVAAVWQGTVARVPSRA